jgi:hypothetical protein
MISEGWLEEKSESKMISDGWLEEKSESKMGFFLGSFWRKIYMRIDVYNLSLVYYETANPSETATGTIDLSQVLDFRRTPKAVSRIYLDLIS